MVLGRRVALAACVGVSGLFPGLAHAATGSAPVGAVLSNETTRTTWTVADYQSAIRSRPSPHAATVSTLRFQTPDQGALGPLMPYVLLRDQRTRFGLWVELRIPGRPNGQIGWVPRGVLDTFHRTSVEIVVDRAARRLTLYRGGRSIFNAPVGVGKPSTPTPAGHYWITESFSSSDPVYGPWAFGTSDFSTLTTWENDGIVGLHGTDEPQLVPGDPSHGCIRMHNNDIVTLSHAVGPGTPLLVK